MTKGNAFTSSKRKTRTKLSSPDGRVGRGVNVDLNLRPTGTIADPLPNLPRSPVRVRQVVEPGEGIGQQAHVGTAKTEASALWSPFPEANPSRPGLALLGLVFVGPAQGKQQKHYISSLRLWSTELSLHNVRKE